MALPTTTSATSAAARMGEVRGFDDNAASPAWQARHFIERGVHQ
jgi:hypothetical protein